MKKLLYLALVFLMPTSLLIADNGGHRIEGYWFSTHANYEIQIKSKSYGIKVKGLPRNQHNWKKLRTTRQHNIFKDSRGNVLIRDARNRLIYKTRSRNRHFSEDRVYHFSRTFDDAYNYRSGYSSSRDCNSRNTYPYSNHDVYDDNYYYREDRRNRRISAGSIRKTLSGEWKTIGLNKTKRVVVRSVSSGINARFKNRDKLVFYAQDREDPNIFTDRKGNRYILKRDLSLKWIGINGKEFILEKY